MNIITGFPIASRHSPNNGMLYSAQKLKEAFEKSPKNGQRIKFRDAVVGYYRCVGETIDGDLAGTVVLDDTPEARELMAEIEAGARADGLIPK
jgi:hypothetical protein